MQRAMELARLGLGSVSPNPLVGCVVVTDNRIIGEGWHRQFGGPHAEVNALHEVTDSSLLSQSTVYVNLEPCSHVGKTPPCADLIIRKGVQRVVIANLDSNPLVAGKGIEKIRAAGIEVTLGVLEKEGRALNKRFFTRIEQGVPYIILKWAESADGYLGHHDSGPVWISSELSRHQVHQWRSEEDAVLVGTRTAAIDNPRLNVRDWTGRNPLRVVIDTALELPSTLHLFDQSQPTLCYNLVRDEERPNLTFIKLEADEFLHALLADLSKRNIGSVIVEGGAQTLTTFINSGWWHEARIFKSTMELRQGISAPVLRGLLVDEMDLSGDRLSIYKNPSARIE